MHDLTLASPGALLLRLLTIAFCMLLYVLPLVLGLWRGETTHDRHAAARAERERAEIDADTMIAVKRAEARAAAEALWVEQQLANARLAVEAQTDIDRAQHRRRVAEALEEAIHTPSQRAFEPADHPVDDLEDDLYLPIAAEAEAASWAAVELPAAAPSARDDSDNLPAPVESGRAVVGERGAPTIPDVTKAAARWIRPLVPTFVARAIDTTTHPLRAARQVFEEVFEEVEEITFSLKRTRKVTVKSEESLEQPRQRRSPATDQRERSESSLVESEDLQHSAYRPIEAKAQQAPLGRITGREPARALLKGDGPGELDASKGPRQLPPGV